MFRCLQQDALEASAAVSCEHCHCLCRRCSNKGRQYCRLCGRLFCKACTEKLLPLPEVRPHNHCTAGAGSLLSERWWMDAWCICGAAWPGDQSAGLHEVLRFQNRGFPVSRCSWTLHVGSWPQGVGARQPAARRRRQKECRPRQTPGEIGPAAAVWKQRQRQQCRRR